MITRIASLVGWNVIWNAIFMKNCFIGMLVSYLRIIFELDLDLVDAMKNNMKISIKQNH